MKFHPRFSGNRDSGANLKKVLALVLAFACAFTMFAGAAFTDQADIKVDADVVDTLVSLGIVEGFEDGSFQPNGTVTRAQMAKMIYVLRTGNSDASAYNDEKSSFTDINGHWARGYIKYCQSLGIIAGKSNTKFVPNEKVSAQEAAKMLLVTLGYNAQKAGLVGTGWASKTNALADEAGLLEDVNTSFTAACPRQYAAQLIYNAIDAKTVVLRDGEYTDETAMGVANKTIGEKYMGLKKTVGTLSSFSKTSGKDTYEMSLTDINENDSSTKYETSFTKVEKDYASLKYKTVKVLYKAKDDVYGVFATDDNTSTTGVLADLKMDSDKKVKLDGTKYDLASTTTVYVDGVKVTTDGEKTIKDWVTKYGDGGSNKFAKPYLKGTKVELLATDGSSDYSILNVTTYEIGKVSYVGSDYINVTTKGGVATQSVKRSDDDFNYPSDIKKDDYVVVTKEGNYADKKGLIEKATVVEGKVQSTKGDNKVQINDNWYTMASDDVTAPKLNARVMLVVVNGYAYYVDTVTVGTDDIALLVDAGANSGVSSKKEARLIFADGTDKIVEIKKYWEDDSTKGEVIQAGTDYLKTPILVTYDVSKDVYTLTKVDADDTAGYDTYVTVTGDSVKVDGSVTGTIASSDGAKNLSKLYFESTGIVFVRYDAGVDNDDPSFKVVTGKTASNYDKSLKGALAVANKSSNTYYAQVAMIDFGTAKTGGSSDDNYLVALDDSYTSKIDGTTYTMVKAWNGSEEKVYKSEDSVTLSAGDVFKYTEDGEDAISIEELKSQESAYVSAYDEGTGDITLMDSSKNEISSTASVCYDKVDSKDTVVFYVNSDDGVGVANGEIRLADYYDDNQAEDHVNVRVYSEDDDQITVLVVDVNNNYTQW
ncbi:S-layer homology domain-containing protein [Agathobaculum butyriciproducens]|uniref:S-layer homology domain-containing protein n=1 Tax=Agathobaculum butyriciproducens TaxID=1628085 RepID=UPI001D094B42|nr:S-layer homology domain-containing protein [Agathobaculum butyriciproducens]MCQ5047835.1 S-layer homology domain-containing protein [Agathobaculum butyriciproducens]